uniref:Uncharacterized protein n=1 Tax=Anguilla anguilla TaxID=7936 RepID=A0A0E9WE43_ANGAN
MTQNHFQRSISLMHLQAYLSEKSVHIKEKCSLNLALMCLWDLGIGLQLSKSFAILAKRTSGMQ